MAWILSQNIQVAINGMNPMHNILCKQIGQKPGLVDDMPNPFHNPTEDRAPPKHPHHKCPNLQWIFKMKDGPFHVCPSLHV
jgi:hypothetical protein